MGTRRLSWAEQFEEKGWHKGVETGIRQILLRQLGARFGPLTEDIKQRVEAIHSVERLGQIAEHVLVARSLEEIDLR
jgi:hypothetical protein